jgi:hypothetical protein
MGEQPVERLRQYLLQLSPDAQATLAAALERGAQRGENVPGGDLILQELRRVVQAPDQPPPRFVDPAPLFFRLLEPFLVDDPPAQRRQYRISRAALAPIWTWIGRDLLPREVENFSIEVGRALLAGDSTTSERLIGEFQGNLVERIGPLLAPSSDAAAARRLVGQIGTPKALDDARDLYEILKAREALAALGERLPDSIPNFVGGQVDLVKALLDANILRGGTPLPYALVFVMSRLATPWQVVRIAIRAAQSDDSARVAATPYGAAVSIVLADVAHSVGELAGALKRGGSAAVATLLKHMHDAIRGLRTELDLPGDSDWGRELAHIRAEVSSVLEAQIGAAPARVRRLLRMRPAKEIAAGATLDLGDVADAEALIELVSACRYIASDLAVSEVTTRSCQDLEQYLDTYTQALLDAVRAAGPANRSFRQSQVQAAVRFCAKWFGQEYASVLAKAAEVATQPRKTAASSG